jgi:DNA mismatch repair protein PMS2
LTASDELLAIEHQEVLRFNGFEIEVDEDAQAGQRIKLVAMPVSKATKKTEFTMQGTLAQHWTCYLAYKPLTDLEELLFLLREHTGSGMMYVPIHCLFLCPLN